jgi:hypothetical protein
VPALWHAALLLAEHALRATAFLQLLATHRCTAVNTHGTGSPFQLLAFVVHLAGSNGGRQPAAPGSSCQQVWVSDRCSRVSAVLTLSLPQF